MNHERIGKIPEPRNLGSIGSHEVNTFLEVPAWKIWESNPLDAAMMDFPQQEKILTAVKIQPMALAVTWLGKGHEYVLSKVTAVPGRVGAPVIPSTYYLEPSTESEAKILHEKPYAASNLEPQTSLSSEEFKNILTS